jgi:DNA-binding CsgD family transcriptional regulator
VELTGGNPFLLLTLLDGLAAGAVAPTADAVAELERSAPAVLRSVVTRLRRLPAATQALAGAVATLGPDASLRQTAALARIDLDAAAAAADTLAAAGLLSRGEPLALVHPLVRSAVYADIPSARRARGHGRAAQILTDAGSEPERVASHLLASSPSGEPWAVAVLRSAARRALADAAPASAVGYLRRAMEEPPASTARAEILIELGRAEAVAGDPLAVERFSAALELCDDHARRARILLDLGRTLYAGGRLAAAAEAFEHGIQGLGDGEPELGAELRAGWATVARLLPELRPRAHAFMAELLQRDPAAATHGDRVLLAHAAEHLVFAGESRDRAVALARGALGAGALLGDETSDGMAWFLAVANLGWCDEFDEYEREIEAGIADARRRGSVWGFAKASYLRSYATYHTGRLAEAVADAQQALDAARYGWEQLLPAVHMWLAWTLMERGQLVDAERALDGAEEDPRWAGTSMHALVRMARGRLALMQDRPADALADLEEAGRIATAALITNPAIIVSWASWAALAAARLGDRDRALALVEDELAVARRFGAPRPIGVALRVAGLVEGGEAGIARMEEAVEVLAASPSAIEHARALVDLGAALRRANRRTAAREKLRQGLDMAHRFGAIPLREQAREELLATGARPRRLLLSGVDALTPSERRCAEMAARGMSNREIAQALFVTLKTVEAHLASGFRKLDVTCRADLAGVLTARG